MRSLTALAATFTPLPASSSATTSHPHTLAATAVDPATDTTYAVSIAQPTGADGDTLVDVHRLGDRNQPTTLLASFASPPIPPTPALDPAHPFVVSFKYLPDADALVLVLANGEVEQLFLDCSAGEARRENVGTFDTGIAAAEWSPDEELLAIVTGDHQLLLLTRTFDPLSESPLHTSSFGADAPVSVGWGARTTQFHGSLGKAAAAAAARADPLAVPWLLSSADDARARIRWRGDGAFFVVSSVEQTPDGRALRRLRIYTRTGEHSSTSEPVPGLEGALAWMPSGELIASTQRRVVDDEGAEELRVVFFERNGLRRGEFDLREESAGRARVREMEWTAGSEVLGVWVERDDEQGRTEHAVQLWHRGNYHWYLKSSVSPFLSAPSTTSTPPLSHQSRGLAWHPEKPLVLALLAPRGVETYEMCWDTLRSERAAPSDDGTVAVIDGAETKLTPFRLSNIPPPMCTLTLSSPGCSPSRPPAHIAFAPTSPSSSAPAPLLFALLHPASPARPARVELYAWALPLQGSAQANARKGLPPPEKRWAVDLPEGVRVARQCAVTPAGEVAVLGSGGQEGEVLVLVREEGVREVKLREEVRRVAVRLGAEGAEEEQEEGQAEGFVLETREGEILEVSTTGEDALPSSTLSPFPEFCPHIAHVLLPGRFRFPALIGLAPSGRLYASSRLLASDASSFVLTDAFLIFTTFSHEAKFLPLASLAPGAGAGAAASETRVETRAVERGARIVAVVPSATALVLQMPRGNLETVCPRPLVLAVVRAMLDGHRYRAAFLLCRRHRIDLNLLHDHDPRAFVENLHDVVGQIRDVDYLNLFLTSLKDEDVTRTMYRPLSGSDSPAADATDKVNRICDLVLADLHTRGDVFHYANTVLTAHVRKRPPAYEDALNVLVSLKEKDADRAEDAVKYIIFLSDANKLFDLALGMYDFPLVLMLAQQSQKDPREYLPFLRALRALPAPLQRHQIDDHLGRQASALRNLAQAGEEHFEAAVEYARRHALWEVAHEVWEADEGKYETVLCANAEDLFDRSNYPEAALLFQLGNQPEKALLAYQRANMWQELFTLARSSGVVDEEGMKELAADVAESLSGKRRYADAARVLLEHGGDVDGAVYYLCEGALHAEAVRITTLHDRPDLVDKRVKPSTLDLQQRLLDDFAEVEEQAAKQVARLGELKKKFEENPYYYFCVDDPVAALENVELAPDGMSDAGTAFTRYTVNPTTLASSTRRSSKTANSRRRNALKKAAGKKGTVYEEMYLLNSLKKAAETKLAELQTETAALLPVLLALRSPPHRAAALELQAALSALEAALARALSAAWDPLEAAWAAERAEEVRVRESGDPLKVAEWEARAKPVEGEEETRRVERPKLARERWRLGMLERGAR
ncbi:Putative elongator complex protein 1 [Rhodotorula kratochvilovae]